MADLTATDILRVMLDERGVEWTVPDEVWDQDSITYWQVGIIKWVAFESESGTLWLTCNSVKDLTPEQAIAATLGASDATRDQLKAENARLRNKCADLMDERERLFRANVEKNNKILRLVVENAKLRELCERCAVELYVNGNVTDAAKENLFDDMRELGIEVES